MARIKGEVMKNKKIIIILILVIIVVASLCIILFSDSEETPNNSSGGSSFVENNGNAPSKVEKSEKDVSKTVAKELYDFIPQVYYEEIAPFTSVFMMDAVINKIMQDNQNLSAKNVDKHVKEMFGEDAKIDKTEVSTPDVNKSIYYYSEEAESYAIIPVGYSGIFKMQIFKNATETDDAYYVYTYALNGIYYYDDEDVIEADGSENYYEEDNFTDEETQSGENGSHKVKVIIGDKDGYDLSHTFDNENLMYDEQSWIKNYENKMPVFRYTLKKDGRLYYLIEVEQINY